MSSSRRPKDNAPSAKRPRHEDPSHDETDVEPNEIQKQQLLTTLWSHWQAYLMSTDEQPGTPDWDELVEMIELANQNRELILSTKTQNQPPAAAATTMDEAQLWQEPFDLVPVLLSVACHALADDAIAAFLHLRDNNNDNGSKSDDDTSTSLAAAANTARSWLRQALTWFPHNVSTWSMLANWLRMTASTATTTTENNIIPLYQYVAQEAHRLRKVALQLLESKLGNDEQEDDDNNDEEDNEAPPSMEAMIEGLVLNQVVGVEYDGPEDEEQDEEDEEGQEDDDREDKDVQEKKTNGNNNKNNNDNNVDQWTASSVEGTARFMAAMQLSMAGRHDDAANELRHFGNTITHCLHPNVWKRTTTEKTNNNASITPPPLGDVTKEPVVFSTPILPAEIHENLKQVFAPQSSFWTESNYSQRGYYSFFVDRLQADEKPKDLIQDVIESYLLPLAEAQLPASSSKTGNNDSSDANSPIVGYEWWVHTRPLSANLGHNLHFDTDEALLKSQQKVTHPIVSSVMYLDGTAGQAGPTIVLNQTSEESAPNADKVWRNYPLPNTVLLFPGNMLHGVLPCSTSSSAKKSTQSMDKRKDDTVAPTFDPSWQPTLEEYLPEEPLSMAMKSPGKEEAHRLSFMVGFWTRRVPDEMADPDRLYGPCGPMPPASSEHSWVTQVQKGYPRPKAVLHQAVQVPKPCGVPVVSPAWQTLARDDKNQISAQAAALEIPKALDHRYFVSNPPACFRESLFERDEDEDDNDELEQEEEGMEDDENED